MRGWRITVLISGLGVAALVTACHGGPHPTFTVDSGLDIGDAVPGDGTCDTGTGICTLRAAIDESNTLIGDDTATIELTVDVDLTIPGTLDNNNTTGDLDITHTVTINGQGHTINAHQLDRVIHNRDGELTIISTTITGGDISSDFATGWGGGILSGGDMDGGIYTESDGLILADTTVTNNASRNGGGGILHSGSTPLKIYSSIISDNTDYPDTLYGPQGTGAGGIFSFVPSEVIISGSQIVGNTAVEGSVGGLEIQGLYDGASLLIEDSLIADNESTDCVAGGCSGVGALSAFDMDTIIRRTTIRDNQAAQAGAMVLGFQSGSESFPGIVIEDSTISGNVSTADDTYATIFVHLEAGNDFQVHRTTVANNPAPNGIELYIYDDSADDDPTDIREIRGSTLRGSSTDTLLHFNASNGEPFLHLGDTVLTNPAGTVCSTTGSFGVAPISAGHNWTSDTTCGFSEPTDIVGIDPMLGPLQDNGGPTHTMLPLTGSPLLNAIAWNTAGACDATTPTDQRGLPRPAVAATSCDIGAAERQPTDP